MNLKIAAIICLSSACLAFPQVAPNTLTPCEKAEGFELMFDGSDIATFRKFFTDYVKGSVTNNDLDPGWVVDKATTAIVTSGETHDVRSQKMYRDFDWRLEYRNDQNQGLVYRFNTAGDYLYKTGVEFAINNNPNLSNEKTVTGAAYDLYANPLKNFNLYATGKWNDVRIVAIKDSVEHWLNGVKVVGYKYHSADFWKRVDNSKWAGVTTFTMKKPGDRNGGYIDEGFVGFQGDHGGKWSLRSMRINGNPATVALGAPKTTNCASPVSGADEGKAGGRGMALEGMSGAGLRVSFDGAGATGLSLASLDGRETSARVSLEGDGRAATVSGWGKPGVYLLRAVVAGKYVLSRKVFLP